MEIDPGNLELLANKPVSFRLYSSRTRTEDKAGDVVEFPQHAKNCICMRRLTPCCDSGKRASGWCRLSWARSSPKWGRWKFGRTRKISEHRWRLQFRTAQDRIGGSASRPAAVISEEALAAAEALLPATFAEGMLEPEQLPAKLEQALGLGRNSWPLSAIRKLADRMLELAEERKRSAAHEARWLNLCGFCLRPGFGFPGDDFRIEQARRIYAAGLQFANQVQNEIEWWIFWGRVAGGLNKNQQTDVFQRLSPTLYRRARQTPARESESAARDVARGGKPGIASGAD